MASKWKLKYQPGCDVPDWAIDDCLRISEAVFAETGLSMSVFTAYKTWGLYSESMAAGWMIIPETDEEIVKEIMERV